MSLLSLFLFTMMLTASLMWPSEGAMRGSGLHLATSWLMAAAVTAVMCRSQRAANSERSGSQSPLEHRTRTQRILSFSSTLAVGLLLSGFWLSTWHVFQVSGDRRAALNLALEWTAVVAAWWISRRLLATAAGQRWLLTVLVSLGVGLSLLGIAQHHVTYSRQAEWYQQQRAAMDRGATAPQSVGGISAAAAARELQRMDVPLEGPARELFERRLLDSSEPTGPFALANTLGGMLAAMLVILIGGCINAVRLRNRFSLMTSVVLIATAFVLSYCLLLTKSRTAWVGLVVGILFLVFQQRFQTAGLLFKHRGLILAASGLLLAGTAIGIASGAIDKEVVLESPRSLQFRLLYWIGASGVIAEEPVFGAGPGNFRQLYLRHKPVESSEEILDPHNILLDAWCSAGLAGFLAIGLLALSGLFLRPKSTASISSTMPTIETAPAPTNSEQDANSASPASPQLTRQIIKTVLRGIAGGLLLHVASRWISGGEIFDSSAADVFDSVNLVLIIPVAGLACFPLLYKALPCTDGVARAAFACLLVHLLGAGGLQISALGLLLLLLHSVAVHATPSPVAHANDSAAPASGRYPAACLAAAWSLAAVVTVWHGLLPVTAADQKLALAAMLRSQGQIPRAQAAFQAAVAADPLSPDSRQRHMELLTYQYLEAASYAAQEKSVELSDGIQEVLDAMFEPALKACNAMIAVDRRSVAGYYFRSRLYDVRQQQHRVPESQPVASEDFGKGLQISELQISELQISEEDRQQVARLTVAQYNAVRDLQHVLNDYPTNATYWFEFADLNQRLGLHQTAVAAADQALQINAVNHQWGHQDRYLGDLQTDRLNQIIAIR